MKAHRDNLAGGGASHFLKRSGGERFSAYQQRSVSQGGKCHIEVVKAWINELEGQNLAAFVHLKAWFDRVGARPGVQRGLAVGRELRSSAPTDLRSSQDSRRVLMNQRPR